MKNNQNKKGIILIPIASTCVVVVLSSLYIRSKKKRVIKNEELKGAKPTPFAKCSAWEALRGLTSMNFPESVYQWSKVSGQIFRLNMPFVPYPVAVSGDPYLCREVLLDRTSVKSKGIHAFRLIHDFGDDILTSEGAYWKHSRKNIAPAFSNNHIKRMNEVVARETKILMRKLDTVAENGESFDVGEEFIHLTLSIICEAAFEYPMSQEEKDMFLEELDIALGEVKAGRMPLRWKLGFLIPAVRRGRLAGKKLVAFGTKILESYRKLDSPVKGTVVDQIANNDQYKSDKERASDILMMLIGGHDTTAYTLAWTLLELAKHQEEQIILQKDLRSRMEKDRTDSTALSYVMKESFRLRTVAPLGSIRRISRDILVKKSDVNGLDHNIVIKKGTVVMNSQMLMNRNPYYYEDPEDFKPSRWKNPSSDMTASLMPFSLGRRNCVGQSLAKSELVDVLASLCSTYHFTVANVGTAVMVLTYKPVDARLFVSKI